MEHEKKEPTLYTPVFRSGHNLSFLLSGEYFNWVLSPSTLISQLQSFESFSTSTVNIGLFVKYTYHINIVKNSGFFIGTTTGILGNTMHNHKLQQGLAIAFPSLLTGLVLNVRPAMRILAALEYGALWYPNMNTLAIPKDSREPQMFKQISPVPDMFSIFAGMDYFYKKNKAFTLNIGWRYQTLTPLHNGSSNIYLNTLSLKNNSSFLQFGVTLLVGDLSETLQNIFSSK